MATDFENDVTLTIQVSNLRNVVRVRLSSINDAIRGFRYKKIKSTSERKEIDEILKILKEARKITNTILNKLENILKTGSVDKEKFLELKQEFMNMKKQIENKNEQECDTFV